MSEMQPHVIARLEEEIARNVRLRAAERDEMERDVAKMRSLGVEEWDGIVLGPAPAPRATPETPEQARKRAEREAKERAEAEDKVLFAASEGGIGFEGP